MKKNKIYIYYKEKYISGGMGGPQSHYSEDPEYYASLNDLLIDHPNAKKDDLWNQGEVYKEGILK